MKFKLLDRTFEIDKNLQNYVTLYKHFIPAKKAVIDDFYNFIQNYNDFKRFPYDIEEYFKSMTHTLLQLCCIICNQNNVTKVNTNFFYDAFKNNNTLNDFNVVYYNLLQQYKQFEKENNLLNLQNNSVSYEGLLKIKDYFLPILQSEYCNSFSNSINNSLEISFKTFINIINKQLKITKYSFKIEDNFDKFKKIIISNINYEKELNELIKLIKTNPFDKRIYLYIVEQNIETLNDILTISDYFNVDLSEELSHLLLDNKKSDIKKMDLEPNIRNQLIGYYKYLPKSNLKQATLSKNIFLNKLAFLNISAESEFASYIIKNIDTFIENYSSTNGIDKFKDMQFGEKEVEAIFNRLNISNLENIKKSLVLFNTFCTKYDVEPNIKEKYFAKLKIVITELKNEL